MAAAPPHLPRARAIDPPARALTASSRAIDPHRYDGAPPTPSPVRQQPRGPGGLALLPIADTPGRLPCQNCPDEFFAAARPGVPTAGVGTPTAAALCGSCNYRAPCLDWLLSVPEQVGYGGGMTESARRRLYARRRAGHVA